MVRPFPHRRPAPIADLVPVLSSFAPRLAVAAAAFAVAFACDVASGKRYSMPLGSSALLVSLLALIPWLRRIALPVGAYAAVWIAFNLLRAVADDTPWAGDRLGAVAVLERRLAGGELPGRTLQRLAEGTPLYGPLAAATLLVYLSYFLVPHLVAVRLLARDRTSFWRYLLATGLLFAIGSMAFLLLPSKPPWLADPAIRRLAHDWLSPGGGANDRFAFDPNPVAAMPSLHLGVTALLVRFAPPGRWRLAALAYAFAIGFALVFTGEHALLEVLAGALAAAFASWLAARIVKEPGGEFVTARGIDCRGNASYTRGDATGARPAAG